jgi:ABC-2 type transport system permease protein
MTTLVKKDFLTISKSKSVLLELLFMPFILIMILGFSLGNVMFGDFIIDTFHVGIIKEENLQNDLKEFERDLRKEKYSEPEMKEYLSMAESIDPLKKLVEVLEDESLKDILLVDEYRDVKSAKAAMKRDKIAGYLAFPDHSRVNLWETMLLKQESPAVLDVVVEKEGAVSAKILQSVVSSFISEYNLESSITLATNGQAGREENLTGSGKVN